ncbi:hypothetical protein NPX13_g3073 [Xylaria arbuscula]|uniref:BZIP domain-containing protein n=1 Tax=Xylaria arbuscula TaxID=114810 RepID=A0A9W8TNK0_9PEZI|nr:hypothetical protein NPX13_g3073 [Xylaria arbuscula]
MDAVRTLEQANTSADADVGAPTKKHTKKRVLTAARKEQNKIAQRAYRQRQRDQRRVQKHSAPSTSRRLEPRQDNIESLVLPNSILGRGVDQTPTQSDVGDSIATELAPSSMSQNESNVILQTYTAAVPPTITSIRPPAASNLAFGLRGSLEDNSTAVLRACLSNAVCIGIDVAELMYCERPCMSPFYRPTVKMGEDPKALIAASTHDSLPESLKPTIAQILVPHHASLDLIPLPRLRERAILMCAALPHIFSLWEMKLDIYTRNALTCQGRHTSRGSESQSWDMRSWQAAPWFLCKWKMVIDANDVNTNLVMPGIPGLWI